MGVIDDAAGEVCENSIIGDDIIVVDNTLVVEITIVDESTNINIDVYFSDIIISLGVENTAILRISYCCSRTSDFVTKTF